jgi:hypothetical protein
LSSIERAKSFMQRRARLIALTAVPLASLAGIAPSARAGAILTSSPLILDPGGTDTCVTGGSGGPVSGSCLVSQLSPGSSLTGISITGSGSSANDNPSGGAQTVTFSVAGGTTNGGGLAGVVVPIAYAFTITTGDNESPTLEYSIAISANGLPVFSSGFIPTTAGSLISGTVDTSSLTAPAVTSYGLVFTVEDTTGVADEELTVSIPVSIDSVGATTGVPEPGTFALLGFALSALGTLAWWRRRGTSNTAP